MHRLHSRERQADLSCYFALIHGFGALKSAEHEFREGMALAESSGEQRLTHLLKVIWRSCCRSGPLDEAFKTARENYQGAETLGLLLANGRPPLPRTCSLQATELERNAAPVRRIFEMLGEENRASVRLWLGAVAIEALFQSGRREEASRRLAAYRRVSACQTPRCEREIVRLKNLISDQ